MKKTVFLILLAVLIVAPSNCLMAQEPPAPKDELKILSWNIYMLPRFVFHTGKRKRAREIAKILSKSEYDIIVFQEAFHGDARRILRRSLKNEYTCRIGPANRKPWWFRTSSGVWIVSKIPLKKLESIEYSECDGFADCAARKGAIIVEGEFNGQTFQLMGTHIQAGGPDSVKLAQYKQMGALANKYKREAVPQILAGDFNMATNEASFQPMIETLGVTAYEIDGERKFSAADDNDLRGSKNNKLIDFVFYRPNGHPAKAIIRNVKKITQRWSKDYEDLSDHYAIEAFIRF